MVEQSHVFVYAIVPADVEPTVDVPGVGDPPGRVDVLAHRQLAALVSEVDSARPLVRPADLTTYQELLDGVAAISPVLPVRFGTVVAGADAVRDLLEVHHDRFRSALDGFEGRVQYTVHGRYDERELLGAVLAENADAAALAQQVHGRPEAETREQRIRLGEIVSRSVDTHRQAEQQELLDLLGPVTVASSVRRPVHEWDALHVAFLVDAERQQDFVATTEEYAAQRRESIRMRLLGPLAPYDFVDATMRVG